MKKIYAADDDPNIMSVMQFALSKMEGVESSFFENGLDLYRAIQAEKPDAVITDIILPKLDGLAVTRLLKFDEKYRGIRVMVISSIIDPDIEEQVKKVQADDFLRKPFKLQELKDRAAQLLA